MKKSKPSTFKKLYPKLYRQYAKELSDCHSDAFENGYGPMDYFVTYLQYMRDRYILTAPEDKDNFEAPFDTEELAALCKAINDYEKYVSYEAWILVYETLTEESGAQKTEEIDELLAAYTIAKQLHWESFWDAVRKYMVKWSVMNDFEIQENNIA